MIIFEISGLDYVGLIIQIDHYDLIRAKKRFFPVLTGNPWAGQKSITDFLILIEIWWYEKFYKFFSLIFVV